MGKIRVKTFDEANPEEDLKKKAKKEAKKAAKLAEKAQKSTEEILEEKPEITSTPTETAQKSTEPEIEIKTVATEEIAKKESVTKTKKSKKEKFAKTKTLSARIADNKKIVSKNQTYPLDKAVELLAQFKSSKFDESVELHINVREQGTSGVLNLPHGSGKTLRIKIADDALLSDVEKGKIDFDILVATPDMMPKLAKVARVLGPRGLMPNPKNGTVTPKPEEAVKKFSGGEIRFKTESKAPVIHLMIGKISFGEEKIKENAKTAIDAVGVSKIKSATLTSTMNPGIKLQIQN